MAVTYFGHNAAGANYANAATYSWWLTAGYTCPGSGLQNVITLDYNIGAVGTGNVRCAIYTAAKAFVTQWDAEKDPAGTGWLAVTSFVDQSGTPHSPQLTGGDTYLLVSTGDGSVEIRYDSVTSGDGKAIYSPEYTGGFPATLGAGSNEVREMCIRCGVEPASVAESIIVLPSLQEDIAELQTPSVTAIQSLFDQRKHVKMIF